MFSAQVHRQTYQKVPCKHVYIYIYLAYRNRWLITCVVVYKTDLEKYIKCYVDADFASGGDKSDAYNADLSYFIQYM